MELFLAVAVIAALAGWLRERSSAKTRAAQLEGRLDAEARRADKLEEEVRGEHAPRSGRAPAAAANPARAGGRARVDARAPRSGALAITAARERAATCAS